MNKTVAIVLFLIISISTSIVLIGQSYKQLKWYTNLDEALEVAKQENRPIFINFTGSDWCYWCQKLEDEILSQPEFIDYASENLVTVIIDFPRKTKLPAQVEAYNRSLADQYMISGFPTVLLLDPNGKLIEQTGYIEGGANNYVKHIETILSMNSGIYNMFENLDFTLNDIDGNQVTLSKIGGFIILDFWSSWCEPCRLQINYLEQFNNEFKSKGLTIVGVNNEPAEIQKKFLQKLEDEGIKVRYLMLVDKGKVVTSNYRIKGIPVTYFIAPDGTLIKKGTGFKQSNIEQLQKLIKNHLLK